jgi:hypothetical protein
MKYGEEVVYALLDLLNEHKVSYMLDVVGILKVRGERLDFEYIREWCAQLCLLESLAEAESRATSH